ncbi:uncharacterized protein LOC132615113 isoform X5 [Lycium barbarum]|uniref:uncharacterized protein LOC132615113 isoform X5 n=1 Tax=Lycium barbarum TaxID=112863 RepID=UPI00293E6A78|nr:uncharacterized protein LOC132615113 isoform X5 [Lycium barbarum]
MLQFLHFLLDASGEGNHCHAKENNQVDLKFALPGKKRQDSVYSLLQILLRFLRRCTLKVKDISCIGGYQRWCPRRYSEAVIKSEDATFSLVCPMSTC